MSAPAAGACSPSRASRSLSCIITGRNHHANATAAINELATGYPGYNGQIPFENGFWSEMLWPFDRTALPPTRRSRTAERRGC